MMRSPGHNAPRPANAAAPEAEFSGYFGKKGKATFHLTVQD
jgi:hypothetical protein